MVTDPMELVSALLSGRPGSDDYFPVMALATVDEQGNPDVRTVLLSEITSDGWLFHTDGKSRKVAQLLCTPTVALMLTIPERAAQVVVRGMATRVSGPELASSYRARTRYLQLLAWLNTPDMSRFPTAERRRVWAEFAAAHPEGSLQAPPDWAGFVVSPTRVTVWQGDPDGPSHRMEYSRTTLGWSTAALPG